MARGRLLSAALLLIIVACGSDAPNDEAVDSGFGCESAPEEERRLDLAGVLTLTPNPVTAGAVATLDIGTDPAPRGSEEIVGWGASWECWNGREWVATHLLQHGLGGYPGDAVPGVPGNTTTIPAIAYRVPGSFLVTIPEVPPGWYRISEHGGDVGGHLLVEVIPVG